jgi:DNA-directed RNA polymerase specialized sigma24 family protein
MVTCRAISKAVWEQAREALVFYFERRVGFMDAEDLAQDTLAAIWRRADFEFEVEEDFPKICYAFAKRILKASLRKDKGHLQTELQATIPAPERNLFGLNSMEMEVYLDEVMTAARSGMLEHEWRAIENRARYEAYGETQPLDDRERNRLRVEFHRAKEKLTELLGRGKKS